MSPSRLRRGLGQAKTRDSGLPPSVSRPPEVELRVAKGCWRAVTTLAVDRAAARAQLQACFCAGKLPEGLDGRTSGYFLTTTLGAGADSLFAPIARIWMPWKGKLFAAASASGWNWFANSARGPVRLLFPGYEGVTDDRPGTFTAFRFRTTVGRSGLMSHLPVLRIDYDLSENPRSIRSIADELVQVGEDVYLGQALLQRGKGWLRVGWFALESHEPARAEKR